MFHHPIQYPQNYQLVQRDIQLLQPQEDSKRSISEYLQNTNFQGQNNDRQQVNYQAYFQKPEIQPIDKSDRKYSKDKEGKYNKEYKHDRREHKSKEKKDRKSSHYNDRKHSHHRINKRRSQSRSSDRSNYNRRSDRKFNHKYESKRYQKYSKYNEHNSGSKRRNKHSRNFRSRSNSSQIEPKKQKLRQKSEFHKKLNSVSSSDDSYSQLKFSSSEDSQHTKKKQDPISQLLAVVELKEKPKSVLQPKKENKIQEQKQEIKEKQNLVQKQKTLSSDILNSFPVEEIQIMKKKKQIEPIQNNNVVPEVKKTIEDEQNNEKEMINLVSINQRRKRELQLNKKDIFEMIKLLNGYIPIFPNVNDDKQDKYITAWWECISVLYFSELSTLTQEELTLIELTTNKSMNNIWYKNQVNQELLNLSQNQEYYEPLIMTYFTVRNTLNILFKTEKYPSIYRYNFLSTSHKRINGQINTDLFIQSSKGQEIRKGIIGIHNYRQDSCENEQVSGELSLFEIIPINQQEIEECESLRNDILDAKKQYQIDFQEDEFHCEDCSELDVCYYVLNKQLQSLVKQNDQIKQKIHDQIKQKGGDINQMIQQQNLTMDILRWHRVNQKKKNFVFQVINSIRNGYQNKTAQILTCFYRIPDNQATSQNDRQKGITKMQKMLSKQNSKPLDTDCRVCFDNDSSDINPVIYCDKYLKQSKTQMPNFFSSLVLWDTSLILGQLGISL